MPKLAAKDRAKLLETLEARFARKRAGLKGGDWADIVRRLDGAQAKLWSLGEMERTGGEPDVVGRDETTGAFLFVDCAAESPAGRRSLCYDRAGWESRKEARPTGDAVSTAAAMGVELLNEIRYRALQELGRFDLKTSSWLATPPAIRALGGALFGDRRYDAVFVYHNGAQSYYAARGFRAALAV
ncbi:MAG: DUF4256 domain-containing protein [Parvularculaceae bacterium]|nr:DUF4256 domain-containing protein [Parvularculaceae bacterium]